MSEENNLPTVESPATEPKLTPGGAEIVNTEVGFVQTAEAVGPEVLQQDGN